MFTAANELRLSGWVGIVLLGNNRSLGWNQKQVRPQARVDDLCPSLLKLFK